VSEGDPAELTVRAADLRQLFTRRDFDPLVDDPDTLRSIPQVTELSDLIADLSSVKLRVLLPRDQISVQTENTVRRALERYCANGIAEAELGLRAWRRLALRAFLVGLGFFAVSLLATAAAQRATFLPEEIRTLATETLVIVGWIVMWQPLDDLLIGWWPIREQERKLKALRSMHLSVEGAA
jgi:hypothetical protein